MNDNPMCDVGRYQAGWEGPPAKCNRRATVHRGDHWWCSKHDPARLRVVAAYNERTTTLQAASTEDLLRELARRGAR